MRIRSFVFVLACLFSCLSYSPLIAVELTEAHRAQFARCKELQAEGKWRDAREIIRQLVGTFEGDDPSQHQLAFTNELANLDQRLGDYLDAERGYRTSLRIADLVSGPETKLVSQLKNNLAALKQVTGDFEEAERLNREALSVREQVEGKGTVATVPPMNNLAGLLWCIGDLEAAETLYRDGLAIRQQSLGDRNLDTARSMANLGGLLYYQDETAEAAPLIRDAVDIFVDLAGPDHPETYDLLLFLGEIERAEGSPERALDLYRRVFEGRLQAFGNEPHVEIAEAMRRVGDAERELGNYAHALELYQRADTTYLALLHRNHPDRLDGLFGAGLAAVAEKKEDVAREMAGKASEIEFANLRAVLAFTDERQRLAYQDMFRGYQIYANLGAAEEVAESLLRRKGVVIDSLLAESRLMRRADTPAAVAAVEELKSARTAFRSAFLSNSAFLTDSQRGMSLEEAEEQVRKAYERLLKLVQLDPGDLDPTALQLTDLQQSLEPGSVLIDFLAFDRYLGRADFEPRYGAAVVTADSVAFVDCTGKEGIDRLLTEVMPFAGGFEQFENEAALDILQNLHASIVEPLLPHLAGKRTLYVCPEGPLNFIPFACLVGKDGRFLIEDFDISYVSAARELVRRNRQTNAPNPSLLVGNPGFSTGEDPVAGSGTTRGLLSAMGASSLSRVADSLTPLEGAEIEVAELEQILRQGGLQTEVIVGRTATEETLREKVQSPQVLHLATHGMYLPSLQPPPEETRADSTFVPDEVAGFQNPLFGSWLALTGARDTVAAWSRGVVPDPESDGILMANEAAELNLENTLLVTLSACDTATGEATNGDGVLGIRRGFRMAGAQNILTTLWPISDTMTVTIMREFYQGLTQESPAASLSATQRKWLVTIRDDPEAVRLPTTDGGTAEVGGLSWAVSLGGPFLLSR